MPLKFPPPPSLEKVTLSTGVCIIGAQHRLDSARVTGLQIDALALLGLYCAALATAPKELGLCHIRRHLQDFDPQGIFG